MCLVTKIRTNYSNLSDKSAEELHICQTNQLQKYVIFLIYANIFRIFLMYPQKKNDFCNIFLQNTVEQICKIICKYQLFFVSLHVQTFEQHNMVGVYPEADQDIYNKSHFRRI